MTANGRKVHLLVADEDPGILNLVSSVLESEGFLVFSCRNADAALRLLHEIEPALVILDAGLPAPDGLAVCRRIRSTSDAPIIMTSTVDDPRHAAAALEAGADDFVRKPFGSDELRARVRAILRRSSVAGPFSERIEAGPLLIDGERHSAHIDEQELDLSANEFVLLGHLMKHRDRVLTHEQLLEAVWGRDYIDSRQLLRVTMCRLRQKLNRDGADYIQTLPRVGYRLRIARLAA
ncbi:MAG: response regulator transcription factor [Chloroflexi bacterium]|nr:response regulator transcription factor [Chloroflexota bacterium]